MAVNIVETCFTKKGLWSDSYYIHPIAKGSQKFFGGIMVRKPQASPPNRARFGRQRLEQSSQMVL
jgi:hypothetical protein